MNKLKVVLSLMTRDSDYQLAQAKAAEAVAQRQNLDLEIFYADGNPVTQSSQLLNLIHKYKSELSAILVAPAGGTEFPQVGKAAVSAGIAWVVLNRDGSSLADLRRNFQVPAFAVSSDHKQVGRIQAQQLAAILPQEATVLYIQGPSSSLAAQHRLVGLEGAKPPHLTLKILKSSNWTEEGGFQAASSWLRLTTSQQQPIGAVAAQKDFIAMGARRAFEEAKALLSGGTWSQLPFLGVDGLPLTGQAYVNRGSLIATVVVPPVAGTALEAVVKAIATKTKPPDLLVIPSHSYPAVESLQPVAAPVHPIGAPNNRSWQQQTGAEPCAPVESPDS
jgi:ABC-type sugar transport system substrate-binding protein